MIQQSFFWVFTQRSERHNLKRYSHPHVCHSIIYNSQDMKTKKRPWCWDRLGAGGEGKDRGWDGRMASPTQKDMRLSKLWELAFCELKKTRYSKLRNLALFYIWEDLRGWAHWNHSLHMQLSSLGAVTCVFHILPSLGAHHREWLQTNGCQIPGILLLPEWGFRGSSDSKESIWNARDLGLTPGSGRSPGKGNGYTFQDSCLGNSKDRGAWWATVQGVSERVGHDWMTNTEYS